MRILLVEDEPQVRSLIRTVLSKQGFRVIEKDNGLSALLTVQDLDGAIGLMITEYSLPGMGGANLASRMKEQFPTVPVLLMSSGPNSCDCTSGMAFLSKPFVPSELLETIRRLLAGQETQCV